MQRSRLKNIINKSQNLNKSTDSFKEFKNSLPKDLEINDNYRLEAAWKAYGRPKSFKEALWEGLIQPISDNNYKFPSIGYNEETDSYEYLNKGKENETVARDIRVWDNDIIPLVKELKLGGYVRLYDEEKDCWTYSKNFQKEEESTQSGNSEINSFKFGGQVNVIPEGALHARKNNMEEAEKGEITKKGIPVIDNNGNQQAEIEKEEIIFCKRVTDKLEKFYKQFNAEETSKEDQNKIAIECGQLLCKEILENTEDRTGLILEMEGKQ